MTVRTMPKGSIEYLEVDCAADVPLVAQQVEIAVGSEPWRPASWVGPEGTSRRARLLLDTTTMRCGDTLPVRVRITDHPEVPILDAGWVSIT